MAAALLPLPPWNCLPGQSSTLSPDTSPLPVQAGQLVKTQLGCTASVLGLKASAEGGQLWVRYASGQDAPLDMAR